MKIYRIFPAILSFAILALISCSGSSSKKQADTGAGKTKGDTSIISHGKADAPHDSVSGDPYSKGTDDPNAKLPKK